MTTTTPATPSRSRRRAVTAPQARLLDVGVWLASCVPVVASPFIDRSDLRWIDAVVALVALVLLLVRHRWPIPTLAAGLAAAVIATAVVGRPTAMLPATVFLLYNVAVGTDRRTTIRAGVAGLVSLVACVVIIASNEILGPELLAGLAWPALAVAAGDAVRSRREAIAAAEERAVRAEATREEEARRRVAEERLHIARELHDVVAHQIAVINVQAGVAAHLLTDQPEQAIEALGTVRSSARQVLEELSNILGVLRTNDDPTAATSPAPTMHDLPALIDSYERAGLHVTFDTSGDDHTVGDATAIAVYRTVQEGLTNAHRHGDGTARVRLTRHQHEIELVITNHITNSGGRSTTPGAGPGSGFGLIGMRERVHAAGGTLTTGAGPDGVFTVDARFPIGRDQGDA